LHPATGSLHKSCGLTKPASNILHCSRDPAKLPSGGFKCFEIGCRKRIELWKKQPGLRGKADGGAGLDFPKRGNLGVGNRTGKDIDLGENDDAGEGKLLGEDLGCVAECGVSGCRGFAREGASVGKVAVEVQGIHGDDEVAQEKTGILGDGGDQRPRARGPGAFEKDLGWRGIERGDFTKHPAERAMKIFAGVGAVKCCGAPVELTGLGGSSLVGEEFRIESEVAEVVHNDGRITQ